MAKESSAAILEVNTDNGAPFEKEILEDFSAQIENSALEYNAVSTSSLNDSSNKFLLIFCDIFRVSFPVRISNFTQNSKISKVLC